MKKTSIAFIEDNQIFYQALKLLLLESKNFDLVGMFSNAESFIKDYPFIKPEIVLMDINLPGISGIEAVERMKTEFPEIKIIMLTVHDDDENIFNSLKAGADGYLLKKNALESLEESILLIKDGGSPITPIIANKIINFFKTKETETINDELSNLTSREINVLNYIAEGFLNKEIADKLFLSVDSIKKITQSIYEKLQVRNRSEAIKKYLNQKKK
jgi:DNA-binding NarL/FixJ family response regulator